MTTPPSVSFVQHLLPALESGSYTLTAAQDIAVQGQGETLQATQAFFVKGIRYQLDDGGVDSVFPPPGAQGEFGNVLPHVVLTDPTLPWQRSPGQADTSWLTVLLFDELDPPPRPQLKTIADLAGDDGVFAPPRPAEHGEKPDDPVTVIDVPASQYQQITPSLADLAWLAHTRLSQPGAKATVRDAAPSAEFAVVFGSRLPAPGHTSTAYLVSLEGFGPYLPSDDAVAILPAQTTSVRLVVLRSWTFSAIQLKQSFQGILERVDMTPATLQLPMRSGDSAGAAAVSQAFGMGYTAMDHVLRDGSGTVSWYRGPLLPLGGTSPPVTPAQASDELLRYDPGSGMFDVSYAAAWQLGRLLALHDRSYATALFRWKLTVMQQTAGQLEEDIVDQLLPPPSGGRAVAEDLPPMHRRLIRVIRDVVGPAAGRLAAAEAAATPGADGQQRRYIDRAALAERLAALPPLGDPPPGTDEYQVVSWLTRLHLLHGVPFAYLVPDIGMLPAESIRFFQVDNAWVEALIDGAFSIGAAKTADLASAALRALAAPAVRAHLPRVRAALTGGAAAAQAPETISGFLLRSAVVSGWPGIEARVYADVAAGQPLPLLRLERVAPSLLLCLVGGVPQRVDLLEPPEAVHFGVDAAPSQGGWQKQLRYAAGNVGHFIPGQVQPVTLRPCTANVLRVSALAQAMSSLVGLSTPAQFTAAQFGLEMVEGVQAVSFRAGS